VVIRLQANPDVLIIHNFAPGAFRLLRNLGDDA
jgi:hypothetical protein